MVQIPFRNGINFQLIRTSGARRELWGSVCLSCKYQVTQCHRGFCIIRSYHSFDARTCLAFSMIDLIVIHLTIHLTPKRKWFTSLERSKVFHYLIISANSYSLHLLVSVMMVPHTSFPVGFSLSLPGLLWTSEAGSCPGIVRMVEASVGWGPQCWTCMYSISCHLSSALRGGLCYHHFTKKEICGREFMRLASDRAKVWPTWAAAC